ncbi:MAG: DUF2235 domain-containing protein [Puia sp.]|nr:DUF2235 domain-containing protein [Puia sp.]
MKRLITCSDGTWDRPGNIDRGLPVQSNVQLIYNCICGNGNGVKQLKAYDTGVGSSTFSIRDQLLGGATGLGIDKKIKDIYTFFVMNYQPGDEIYLFGFSRGAYTARSLAGFIRNCGILKPAYLSFIDRAYELYRDRNDYTSPDSDLMVSFKANYCVEPVTRIKFIGVWDTVGSLGIPLPAFRFYNMERYKFHDETLSSTVDFAYHALAVDERRALFKPTLWQESTNTKLGTTQIMEQRWFPGVHCNIGGGYTDRGLSDTTLAWMIEKAKGIGLYFDPAETATIHPDYKGELRDSFTPLYWLSGRIWRDVMKRTDTHEQIDESVYARHLAIPAYTPKNIRFPK